MNQVSRLPRKTGKTSLHDAVIGALPNQSPWWLIEGTLLGHEWRVATDDQSRKKDSSKLIVHDAVVAPGNGRLADADREHDLVTSKLVAYNLLEGSYRFSATTTAAHIRTLHWLMRWREEAGFHRMADLTNDAVFVMWAESLRRGKRESVDWDRRVPLFLKRLADGEFQIPLRETHGGEQAKLNLVANELGASAFVQLPLRWRLPLLQEFADRGLLEVTSLNTLRLHSDEDQDAAAINRAAVAALFGVWEILWTLRESMPHDPIGYNPFHAKSPYSRATAFATDADGRTGTASEEQVCFLVDRALRWVFDYSPNILATLDELRMLKESLPTSSENAALVAMKAGVPQILGKLSVSGPGAPGNMRRDYYSRTGFTPAGDPEAPFFAEVAFSLLPTACAIVIATFTARRREEIASLRRGCVELDADGEPWMVTWIEKTLRDIDRIPIPVSVIKAVEVLERLSAAARSLNQTEWLFEFIGPVHGEARGLKLGESMKRFADYVAVPPLPNGDKWNFTPHQFRRFFAIVYYHRFRYASLTALSEFLRHYDPDMTRRYISEATRGALARVREAADAAAKRVAEAKAAKNDEAVRREQEVLNELKTADRSIRQRHQDFEDGSIEAEFARMWAVAIGQEAMGGHKGEAIKRELESLISTARRDAELAPPGTLGEADAFNGLLMNFVRSRRFEPHPQGHSYCGCGRSDADLASAACLRRKAEVAAVLWQAASGPDLAYADPFTCSGCPHNIQMPENRGWWERRLRAYFGQAQTSVSEHMGHTSRVMGESCAAHIVRCFEDASPMAVTLEPK